MSDQNKYVNAYIDIAVGMLHEQINQNIQTKTQLKVANDLVSEKDQVINSLVAEVENLNKQLSEKELDKKEFYELREKIHSLESELSGLRNKASHVDAFAKQISDMKRIIQEKDSIISKISFEKDTETENLKRLLDQINSKSKKSKLSTVQNLMTMGNPKDDF